MNAITFRKAKALVLRGVKPLGSERVSLREGLGREPLGTLRAPYPYPLRDVSAMDGFAYRFQDTALGRSLKFAGERRAGDGPGAKLKRGQTVRIMTGAPVPPGADSVIPKEKIREEAGWVHFLEPPVRGGHVRRKGEGTRKGQALALPPGPLTDRTLGYLASLGIGRLRVRRNPRVAVLVTGNELVEPGQAPGSFGVFESNGSMLGASLKEMGILVATRRVRDRASLLAVQVQKALKSCDVLLVTGGVSVGESDATKEALRLSGVRKIFWRVSQKPGGPLFFGRKGKKAVFGLPGNPAAVYSCFQLYVQPLLRKLRAQEPLRSRKVRLLNAVKPLDVKTSFMKASLEGHNGHRGARVLRGQGSHLLEGLALGDGLLEVPPGSRVLPAGTVLDFYPFQEATL